MLPNGYHKINVCLTSGNKYIDTGVTPSSNTDIEIACLINTLSGGSTRNFIFGGRDGTSNTSLGINLCKTFSNGYYVSYGNTNTLISSTKGNFAPITTSALSIDYADLAIFKLSDKITSLAETISYNVEDKSTVSDFNATNTMYLFGLNNNGNVIYAPYNSGISYCKIWDNKVLVKDYLACCDEQGNVGLYEFIEDIFYPINTESYVYYNGTLTISPTTNGNGVVDGMVGKLIKCGEIKAIPNDDYVFVRWELNDEVLSNSNPYFFTYRSLRELGFGSRDTFSPKAIFTKKNDINDYVGFKMAVYSSVPTFVALNVTINEHKGVYPIKSANISNDGKQKTASVFNIEGSFNVSLGDYVYVYTQNGQNIFNGIVESFDETSITCGSMASLFDKEVLLHSNVSKNITYQTGQGEATVTIPNVILSFALSEMYLHLLSTVSDSTYGGITLNIPWQWYRNITDNIYYNAISYSLFANETYGDPVTCNFPSFSSTEVKNLYEYLCEMYSELNVYVKETCIPKKVVVNNIQYNYLEISFVPVSVTSDPIVLASNNEQVRNIVVSEESDLTSALIVFDSNGANARGMYTVNENGEVILNNDFNKRPDAYIPKIVLSNDNLNTIVQSNISSGKFNHKITFDLLLDNKHSLRFDDFKINRRVDFYNGNKLYRSVITAIEYDIDENKADIEKLRITLGMARNNLTSKLNLKKVGKR